MINSLRVLEGKGQRIELGLEVTDSRSPEACPRLLNTTKNITWRLSISNEHALYLGIPRAMINPLRMKNVRELRSPCADRVAFTYAAH